MSAHATNRPLARRRASFPAVSPQQIREIACRVAGDRMAAARVEFPSQGINNQTWILHPLEGEGLVVKLRPRPGRKDRQPRNSPHWPRYLQELLGPVPNGGIETLLTVTRLLCRHGSIRVPQVYCAEESGGRSAAAYLVSEQIDGIAFDWSAHVPGEAALEQLGEHLARMHAATEAPGFGIFETGGEFPASAWWLRFGKSYQVLAEQLARASPAIRALRPQLDLALERAVETGSPIRFALICQDQAPTHYLDRGDGLIGGMVDIEGHLWAPAEYEVATVAAWAQHRYAVRRGYERRLPWPELLETVFPAYAFYTWMEWLRCTYVFLNDNGAAAGLECFIAERCRELMG